jgi:hypothetical protein
MRARIPENLGFTLLAIWLILEGVLELMSVSALNIIMGILALFAGLLILFNTWRVIR